MNNFEEERYKLKKHPIGFWEVENKPSPYELTEYYSKKYYQEAKGSYQQEYSRNEIDYFMAKLSQRWEMIKKIRGDNFSGRLLDVGCGEGFTLSFFKNLNWEVKGFDFNSHGLEAQNPDCLGYIVTGDIFSLLESEISSNQKYEIIWLQNVLEHVLEPISLLKKLHVLMSPNGITVISVPNDFSTLQQKALEHGHINQKFWVALPDHLSYFNYNSLFKVVEATGWNCLEILADFPIDWFLFNPHTNYIRDKNVGKAAHSTRVELENLIHTQSADKVNIFYAALARLGFGRNLTAFIEIPKKMRTK